MENRIKELKENLPKTKRAIDNLINTIASYRDIADDDITSKTIEILHKGIEEELRND